MILHQLENGRQFRITMGRAIVKRLVLNVWKKFSLVVLVAVLGVSPATAKCVSPWGEAIRDFGGAKLKSDWFTYKNYPMDALRRNQKGRVVVSFEITPQGRAINCVVAQSSGFRSLDRAVCPALEKAAIFEPKSSEGVPVATAGRLSVDFWLPDPATC